MSKGSTGSGVENRRAKRHQTNMLSCELGDVMDISKTGMRVKCDGKPPVRVGQVLQMKLESSGQRLGVTTQVVWVKRKGLRTYQMGLQFAKVTRSLAAALESLALFGFIDFDAAASAKRRGSDDPDQQQHQAPPEGEQKPVSAAVDLPDYYKVLNLSAECSADDIKQAYRLLALKYHPDVNDDVESAQRFIEISEAYEVLSDSRSRRSYDRRRSSN